MSRPTDLAAVAGLTAAGVMLGAAALGCLTLAVALHRTGWYIAGGVLLALAGVCAFRIWQANR